jgi:predicted transcriptional regulator
MYPFTICLQTSERKETQTEVLEFRQQAPQRNSIEINDLSESKKSETEIEILTKQVCYVMNQAKQIKKTFNEVTSPSIFYRSEDITEIVEDCSNVLRKLALLSAKEEKENLVKNIIKIREILDLDMSDLADIFGVEYSAIYGWLKGEQVSEKAIEYVDYLLPIVNKIEEMSIPRMSLFVSRPILAGHSLLDFIKRKEEENVLKEALEKIQLIVAQENKARMGRKISDNNLRSLDDVSSDFDVVICDLS